MTEFNPPIASRPTEELIAIAHSPIGDWQQSAIDQANAELNKRGVNKDAQQQQLNIWKAEQQQFQLEYQAQRERNSRERYNSNEIFHITVFAPLLLLGRKYDLNLRELKRENYKRKYRQRVFCLIGGVALWIFAIQYEAFEKDQKNRAEIEKADISGWEKNRINDTTELH